MFEDISYIVLPVSMRANGPKQTDPRYYMRGRTSDSEARALRTQQGRLRCGRSEDIDTSFRLDSSPWERACEYITAQTQKFPPSPEPRSSKSRSSLFVHIELAMEHERQSRTLSCSRISQGLGPIIRERSRSGLRSEAPVVTFQEPTPEPPAHPAPRPPAPAPRNPAPAPAPAP